jgi:hypothetical protein
LIDLKHYTTDRCTITLGCEGRLFPVGETGDGTSLIGIPPVGVQNWYARGETASGTKTLSAPSLYNTSTGTKNQMIIAISNDDVGFVPDETSTFTLNLVAEQQQAKDFRQYTYRKSGSFTIVNGVESSITKKVLRYTITGINPDIVEVYVDGVKRDRGTGANEFQLYDGTVGSPVPPNSVLFNTMITGVAPQVDVIVTKAATVSTLSLPFTRMINDEARVSLGAWEGVNAVRNQSTGAIWSLFYCDFTEIPATPVDVKLRLDVNTPSILVQGNVIVNVTVASILLSNTIVHTSVDRLRGSWAPLSMLSSDNHYLVIKFVSGVRELLITEESISDVFPPLEVLRYTAPALLTKGLLGNIYAAQIDGATIIGPDV